MNLREGHLRATAKLYTRVPPLRVLDVLRDLIDVELERNDANRVRIRLAKHCAKTGNLLRVLEVELLAEHLDVPADPVLAQLLDLAKLGNTNLGLVREVEAQFRRRDKRTLLVDVIT